MKAILAKTFHTRASKLLAFAVCAALVVSLGISAYALAAPAEPNTSPEFHVVTEDEYAAIQAGDINLADGVPRVWSNPDAESDSVSIETTATPEFHVVTEDEYVAIQAGEISLDDGVQRIWSNPDAESDAVSITTNNVGK